VLPVFTVTQEPVSFGGARVLGATRQTALGLDAEIERGVDLSGEGAWALMPARMPAASGWDGTRPLMPGTRWKPPRRPWHQHGSNGGLWAAGWARAPAGWRANSPDRLALVRAHEAGQSQSELSCWANSSGILEDEVQPMRSSIPRAIAGLLAGCAAWRSWRCPNGHRRTAPVIGGGPDSDIASCFPRRMTITHLQRPFEKRDLIEASWATSCGWENLIRYYRS